MDQRLINWSNGNWDRKLTNFEVRVYEWVSEIPEGKVATYKQVAEGIGHPNSSRAVGTALSKNPFADLQGEFYVPCHRVISSSFKIGGFMGSQENNIKEQTLMDEGIVIHNGTISSSAKYRNTITTF